MRIGAEDVRRVAALARLALESGEEERIARDLDAVLEHVDAIARSSAASDSLPPETPLGHSLRPDIPRAAPGPDVERFAPDMRDGFFVVPRLSTHRQPE
jgi:aspartyl-tRNA(Asn)/glutamyl-tRNA(Gln) amidotransferase subunit C